MVKRNTKVPATGPSQAVVDACVKLIAQVSDRVAPGEKPLTAKERQRTLKLRRGGHATARTLAALAVKNGLGDVVPVAEMLGDVDYAERLEGLAHDVANLSAVLGDLILQADGRAWKVAVRAYSVLKRFAADDPAIKAQLEPVTGAFATKGRGKAQSRATATPAKATASNVSPEG